MLSLLLALCLALTVVPALAAPASEAAPVAAVYVNGSELSAAYPYFLASTNARSATDPGGGDAVGVFNDATGTLTLQGYNSGYIYADVSQGTKELTIKLIGANVITTNFSKGLSNGGGGNLIITSDDPVNTLTVNVSTTGADAYGIMSGSPTDSGDVVISGKAKVTVSVKETSAGTSSARGLSGGNIKILNDASLTASAETASSSGSARGLFARTLTTINTAGTVTLDASANTAGSYAFGGDLTLTNATKLTLKWKGSSTSHPSGTTLTYDPASFAYDSSLPFVETYTDKVPPVLSDGNGIRTSDTAATLGFTTNETGTAYYLVKDSEATPPTSAEVRSGTSLGAVAAGVVTGKNIVLTAGAKDIYIIVADAAGNNSAPLKLLAPAFDSTPPVLSAGTADRTSDTAAKIGFTTDEAGTAYYLALASGATAPTKAAVKAGTSLGAVTVGEITGKEITLTSGAKDVYVVVEDAVGNISTPLKIETPAWVAPGDNTLIIIVVVILALAVAGFIVYWFFLKKKP